MTKIFLAISFAMLFAQCDRKNKTSNNTDNTEVTYKESLEDFPNPERGFYIYSETKASNPSPLTVEQLSGYKPSTQASNGNYSVFSTLIFRYYVLDIFKDKAISESFLEEIA